MSASKWWISLAIVLCIALPAGLAFAQAAGLAAVGAPDPAHGFPKWYLDKNGLQLAPCLDAGAADPCGLIAAGALPNPALPVVFPTNFPNEVFYNRATARIDGIGGGAFRADLGIALEGAFGGATLTVADGAAAEIVFARLRIRVNGGLVPGASYTATYPFGSQTFVATAAGTINFTNNQGCLAAPPACDFTLALANTNIGPFLQWDPAASVPPAGYIGQPAIPHAIVGDGTNFFSLSGPNVGGPGVNTVQTNLFNVVRGRAAADADGHGEPRGAGYGRADRHGGVQGRRRDHRDGPAGQRRRDAHDLHAVPRRAHADSRLQRQPRLPDQHFGGRHPKCGGQREHHDAWVFVKPGPPPSVGDLHGDREPSGTRDGDAHRDGDVPRRHHGPGHRHTGGRKGELHDDQTRGGDSPDHGHVQRKPHVRR